MSAIENIAAGGLGDERQLGVTAQNVGVLLQTQAFPLPDDAKDERRRLLGEAAASVATSLAAWRKLGDDVYAAASLFQLGVIQRHLGNLDEAERHIQQALTFHEPHNLPDGRFLQRIAEGHLPDPPAGLPSELTEMFTALVEALRSS